MVDGLLFALTVIAALGSGLIAGVFFAFSTFVMTALGRLPSPQGIAAMQSINIVVLNPWFLGTFFGTGAVCLVVVAVALLLVWPAWTALWLIVASLLYIVGTIGVTIVFNVPLNTRLAGAAPDQGADLWARYLTAWTAWNHLRTACAFAASALFILVLSL